MQTKIGRGLKTLASVVLASSFILGGCSEDKDAEKRSEVSSLIDQGKFDSAIAKLQSDCAGFDFEACNLNLGAAFLGKTGFDIPGLGKELATLADLPSDEQSTKLTEVIFDKLLSSGVKEGAQYYKLVIPKKFDQDACSATDESTYQALSLEDKSNCHDVDTYCQIGDAYEGMSPYAKQACLSINPILLKDKISGAETSSGSVDIAKILEFKEVIDAAIPGVDTKEIVSILANGGLLAESDRNENNNPDSLEATTCAVSSYSTGAFVADSCSDGANAVEVGIVTLKSNPFNVLHISVSGATGSNQYLKLMTEISTGSKLFTTANATENNITDDANGNSACTVDFNNIACYPEPELNEDDSISNFSDTVVNVVNSDAVLSSLAPVIDSSGDTDNDALRTEMCTADDGSDLCNGTNEVNQDAILDYFSSRK
jgi:hypothetical protein